MSRLLATLKEKWPEYLIEGVVIVGSIWGAFALEKWGLEKEEQAKQQELLENLVQDLKLAYVQSKSHEMDEYFNGCMLKLALSQSSYMDSILYASNTAAFLQQTIWFSSTEMPSILAYDDMVNSGQTGMITNVKLRKELSRLNELLVELALNLEDKMTVQQLRIDRFMFEELDAVPIITPDQYASNGQIAVDYGAFLKQRAVRNALAVKLSITNESLENRVKVSQQLKKVIDLIGNELGLEPSIPEETKENLPDPLAAQWEGQAVCEVLEETKNIRVLLCSFPPEVGHERHYHAPHAGYVVTGGRMQITDATGTRVVDAAAGSAFFSEGVDWHEVLNVGTTTAQFLIIEAK